MATTVLKMPPAVPAASSTSASETFIRSKDDALPGGAGPHTRVIPISPLASPHVRPHLALHPVGHRCPRCGRLRGVPGGVDVLAPVFWCDLGRGVLRPVGDADLPVLVPPQLRLRHVVPAAYAGGRGPASTRARDRPGRDP